MNNEQLNIECWFSSSLLKISYLHDVSYILPRFAPLLFPSYFLPFVIFIHPFFPFLSLSLYKSLISFFSTSIPFHLPLPESFLNSITYLSLSIISPHLYVFKFLFHSLFIEILSHCFHWVFGARYLTPSTKSFTTLEMLKVMWYDLLTSLSLLLAYLLRFDINHLYP